MSHTRGLYALDPLSAAIDRHRIPDHHAVVLVRFFSGPLVGREVALRGGPTADAHRYAAGLRSRFGRVAAVSVHPVYTLRAPA